MREAYEKMHQAIVKTGRSMVYSLCQYGDDSVWDWGPSVGANLWRTTGDISANFDRMSLIGRSQAGLEKFAGPGHWNDPDMLEVGNGRLNHDENVTHMTLWAMLAAPLIAGNNLTQMSPEIAAILMNKEVIAIDQDALGEAGQPGLCRRAGGDLGEAAEGGRKQSRYSTLARRPARCAGSGCIEGDGIPRARWRPAIVWAAKELGKIKNDWRNSTIPRHGVVLLVAR